MENAIVPVLENGELKSLLLKLNEQEINGIYRTANKRFIEFLDTSGYGLVDGLEAYTLELRQNTKSANTYNTYVAGIKKRIREVLEIYENQIPIDKQYAIEKKIKKIKRMKINTIAVAPEKILSYVEIEQLIEKTKDKTISLIVSFLAYSGCRISEALNIKLVDIKKEYTRKDTCIIRVVGKGEKERDIQINLSLVTECKQHFQGKTYLFEHTGKKYNSRSITQRINQWGYRVLGNDVHVTAHVFRHSFATEKAKQGVSTKNLATMLGHSTTAITEDMYIHTTPSDADWSFD